MNDADAEIIWNLIIDTFPKTWENIETVEPDEIDLQMLHEIENDPDCKEFVSADEAVKKLGLA